MDLGTIIGLVSFPATFVAVWYARRGAVAAEEAVKVARLPFDREAEEQKLSEVEKIALRAALDATTGAIYYHRHFEGKGPHLVLWLTRMNHLTGYNDVPGHEPIQDLHAGLERLVTIGYLEFVESVPMRIGMSTSPSVLGSQEFELVRVTPKGRLAARAIPQDLPNEFVASHGLREFKGRT